MKTLASRQKLVQKLYHEHAAKMPIIDYHCHLIPQMVADDHQFVTDRNLVGWRPYYKWRAMYQRWTSVIEYR